MSFSEENANHEHAMPKLTLKHPTNKTNIDFSIYRKQQLGDGVYSTVYKGRNLQTKETVAIKCMDLAKLDSCNSYTCVKEFRIMTKLSGGDNLTQIQAKLNTGKFAYIAMTYAENGNLHEWLVDGKCSSLEMGMKLSIMHGIANGLAYMHDRNILHCDIKPANIVFDGMLNPLICDFGFSKDMAIDNLWDLRGTFYYKAPEHLWGLIDAKHPDRKAYAKPSDVYSYVLVMWDILTGNYCPYTWMTKHEVAVWVCEQGKREYIPIDTDQDLADLITQGWSHDPASRQTMGDILGALDSMPMHAVTAAALSKTTTTTTSISQSKQTFFHNLAHAETTVRGQFIAARRPAGP